jgi:hypothetical protein
MEFLNKNLAIDKPETFFNSPHRLRVFPCIRPRLGI